MDEEELKAFRKEVAAYCGNPDTEIEEMDPEQWKQIQSFLLELQEQRRKQKQQANGEASSSDR